MKAGRRSNIRLIPGYPGVRAIHDAYCAVSQCPYAIFNNKSQHDSRHRARRSGHGDLREFTSSLSIPSYYFLSSFLDTVVPQCDNVFCRPLQPRRAIGSALVQMSAIADVICVGVAAHADRLWMPQRQLSRSAACSAADAQWFAGLTRSPTERFQNAGPAVRRALSFCGPPRTSYGQPRLC